MPIYEYRCDECGHELEKLQRISEEPLTDCPTCNAASLRRLISPAGFRLKGSGWYETDFKKDKKRNVIEKPADSEGKKDKTDAATSESKTSDKAKSETKTESKSETRSDGKGSKATAA